MEFSRIRKNKTKRTEKLKGEGSKCFERTIGKFNRD